MKDSNLAKMSFDDLWNLRVRIAQLLNGKLQQETRKLQHRLDRLGREFEVSPSNIRQRRPYGKVEPKF